MSNLQKHDEKSHLLDEKPAQNVASPAATAYIFVAILLSVPTLAQIDAHVLGFMAITMAWVALFVSGSWSMSVFLKEHHVTSVFHHHGPIVLLWAAAFFCLVGPCAYLLQDAQINLVQI